MSAKNNQTSIEKTVASAKKVLSDVEEQAKALDPTVKGAVVGGTVGYVISEDNKERNTIVGAAIGYLAGRQMKKTKKEF